MLDEPGWNSYHTPMSKKRVPASEWNHVPPAGHVLREAAMPYHALADFDGEEEAEMSGTTRLSAKNQITLPAALVRRLDLRPGDEIDLMTLGETITLDRRPRTPEEWADRLAGSLTNVWGGDQEINAWVRGERDSWDRAWDKDETSS